MANLEGRLKRLSIELETINEFCEGHKNISYRVEKNVLGTTIPEIYEFTFNLKTFVGINPDNTPIVGNIHKIQIDLSSNYPTFHSLERLSQPKYPKLLSTFTLR